MISSSVRELTSVQIKVLLSYDIVWICNYLPTIWRLLMHPYLEFKFTLLSEDTGKSSVWKVGKFLPHNTASRQRINHFYRGIDKSLARPD